MKKDNNSYLKIKGLLGKKTWSNLSLQERWKPRSNSLLLLHREEETGSCWPCSDTTTPLPCSGAWSSHWQRNSCCRRQGPLHLSLASLLLDSGSLFCPARWSYAFMSSNLSCELLFSQEHSGLDSHLFRPWHPFVADHASPGYLAPSQEAPASQ